jgi:phosphoglycolate phosphatase
MAPFMTDEFGPKLDGTRNDKADLLAHALEVTGEGAADAVMVGDRDHDIDAARANDVSAIAVSWGYGSAEEHTGADARMDRPELLAEHLLAYVAGR